ncbi:peroxiredoxin [Paenirhodobacter enshiensis]|uniref:thioredoxin-dependent peroxiredoxin n=1 Tax=Paenirhodobacter enshiensis TaxID=1105367 RepID=A0A086Y0K2_9RHOB|nr:peroxiredoxin [Paenirhodobacter enshiensis]KFI27802.1 alkyl hydroperoxide reductase [Paenirhodobacter enshiensis]
MPQTGDPAPDFTLPATAPDGSGASAPLTLSALRPKPVVLYFYPKDDTPGCTTEALDFTRLAAQFQAAGAMIVGISRDTLAKHQKFCDKHRLGIALASDEDGAVCEAYGVWVEKTMYGRTSMGIRRSTFLIDGKGEIVQVWPKVSVKGHAEEVLEAVRALG